MAKLGSLQRQVLEAIGEGLVGGSDLASRLGRQKRQEGLTVNRPRWNVDAGLQSCLKRLREAGLIERRTDGMIYGYALTPAGREALKEAASNESA